MTEKTALLRKRILGTAAAIAIALLAGLMWLLWPEQRDRDDIRLALIEASNALHAPGRTVLEAAENLETAEAAAQFVAGEIKETIYVGRLLEPETVLQLRVGNRRDRANLLAALINAQGGNANVVMSQEAARLASWSPEPLPEAYRSLFDLLDVDVAGEAKSRLTELQAEADRLSKQVADADAFLSAAFAIPQSEPVVVPLPRQAWVEGFAGTGASIAFDLVDLDNTPTVPGKPIVGDADSITIRIIARDQIGGAHILLDHSGPVFPEVAISFQPVVSPIDAFGRPPDPASVPAWVPALTIANEVFTGRPFTPAGDLPPSDETGSPPYMLIDNEARASLDINKMELQEITAANWPEMRVAIAVETTNGQVPSVADFALFDGGKPVQARISTLPIYADEQRSVLLLIDASASMARDGRVFAARELAQALLAELNDNAVFGVVSMAGEEARITRLPASLAGDRENAAEMIDATFSLDNGMPFGSVLDVVLPILSGPTDLIMIGDGQFVEEDITPQVMRLANENHRVFSVAIDAPIEANLALGRAWRWDSSTSAPALIRDLLSARSTGLSLDWTAPNNSIFGETRNVELRATIGNAAPINTNYTTPEEPAKNPPNLLDVYLEIEYPGPQGRIVVNRALLSFGPNASPWMLEMQARLMISPAPSPDRVIIAAYIDEWLALLDAQDAAEMGGVIQERPTNLSFAGLQRAAGLAGLSELSAGQSFQFNGISIIMERLDISPDSESEFRLTRTLDVLADGAKTAAFSQASPWIDGLSLAAAEASLIAGDSVTERLFANGDPIVVGPADPMPDWANAHLREVSQVPGTAFVISRQDPDVAWILNANRQLEARLFSPVSKGASAEETSQVFRELRSRLEMISVFSGAAGSVVGLSGIPHGGIIGLLDQNMRMWCFSTVMMGYVGDAISGLPTPGEGDPAVWEERARALCDLASPEGLASAYASSIGAGMISGYVGDVLSGLSGSALSSGINRALSNSETFVSSAVWNEVLSLSGLGPALEAELNALPN